MHITRLTKTKNDPNTNVRTIMAVVESVIWTICQISQNIKNNGHITVNNRRRVVVETF